MSKKNKRKAMRSGAMNCPVCGQKRRLVEHHIHGRDVPRWNQPWNVAWLCANCHDDVHSGDVILEGWVATTAGTELSFYRKGDEKPDFRPDSEIHLY